MSIQKSTPKNPTPKNLGRRHTLRMTVLATALMTLAGGFATVSMAESPAGASAPSAHKDMANCKNPERMEKMREHREAFMHKRLDEMANRLQITASQQPVWDQYKKARLDMMPKDFKRPGRDMNAAQQAQFRAERADHMAKKLADVSKATTNLRAELAPNQQQVLDEMSRHNRHKQGERRDHKRGMHQGQGDSHGSMHGPMDGQNGGPKGPAGGGEPAGNPAESPD